MANTYKPGGSVRLSVSVAVLGVATNLSSLLCSVRSPGPTGQTYVVSLTNDSTGNYHGDFIIPFDGPPGTWWYRFYANGSTPSTAGIAEQSFLVQAKAF